MPPPTTSWGLARRIEQNYARALERLTVYIEPVIKGIDDPYEIIRRLKYLSKSQAFREYSVALAQRMVGEVNKAVNQNWRNAAAYAAHKKGQAIREAILRELTYTDRGYVIRDIVLKNAELIKTIPDLIGKREASEMAKEGMLSGVRSTETAKEINARFPHLLEFQARRIARTEVSKAQGALTQARAQDLGMNWYIWRTSEDARVRPSHEYMDGVLINWGDPPNPEALAKAAGKYDGRVYNSYQAGGIFNCRCYPEPIIDFDWLEFPVKVHWSGSIRRMSREDFLRIA